MENQFVTDLCVSSESLLARLLRWCSSHPCSKSYRVKIIMEPKLWIHLMNITFMLNDGIIMDAGANDGRTSLMLAKHFDNRLVLSVEPIRANVKQMHHILANVSNVKIIHGGLGSANSTGHYPLSLDRSPGGIRTQTGRIQNYAWQNKANDQIPFPIYTVDDLIGDRYKLALGHLDIEGGEVDMLRGARVTIMRDRPIFTVETFPITNASRHAELMSEITSLNYKCNIVPERCGSPNDCRNMVCLPNELA